MLAGTAEAVQVSAGTKLKIKNLERAKNIVRNNEKTPERIPVA